MVMNPRAYSKLACLCVDMALDGTAYHCGVNAAAPVCPGHSAFGGGLRRERTRLDPGRPTHGAV
jgi:hypothetical protein